MAIVKKYRAEVTRIAMPIEGIHVVSFKSRDRKFSYRPGQYLHLALDEYDPSAQWPDSRCFSMQSAPLDDEITITFSVKGRFTGRMAAELAPGRPVTLKLPYGDLFGRQHPTDRCVFIAGGTGITPFLSLFTDGQFRAYDAPRLYFGVRDSAHNIYATYLARAREVNPSFTVSVIAENERGKLDIAGMLAESGGGSTFFISGPPAMIKDFRNYLSRNGVPERGIITDDWE